MHALRCSCCNIRPTAGARLHFRCCNIRPVKVNDVTSDITHISELVLYRKYPIERADRLTTRFGETIRVSIRDRDTPEQPQYKVFLPKRYVAAFKDEDVRPLTMERLSGTWCPKDAVRRPMPINCLLSDSFRRPGFPHPPSGQMNITFSLRLTGAYYI